MNSKTQPSLTTSKPPRRLVFDRRYGWVFDEWKDPSQEALSGGRGMFCILPLTKALINTAIQSSSFQVNLAAVSLVQALKTPNRFTPQVLKANVDIQLQKWMCKIRRHNFNWLTLNGRSSILSANAPHSHQESNGSQNG